MSDAAPLSIAGARALLPEGASRRETRLLCDAGTIREVGGSAAAGGGRAVDARDCWLLPGWIDIQVNDIAWLATGRRRPEEHAERIREVLSYQARRGVTGLILATLAAPTEEVLSYLDGMHRVEDSGGPLDAAFLGGLVEGTFMNPQFHGAHNPRWVVPPDRDLLDRLLDTGAVRLINIAPETSPSAIDLIRHATRRGVVVGCGHAKPHAERLREAVDAGLRYIIHLGNGPTGSNWKTFHDGGMLEEALRNDQLVASVIADNYHVHPQLLRDWIARKEVSRVVATSDAGFATGVPDGRFEAFGIRGEAADGGKYLRVVREDGAPPDPYSSDAVALFGSAVGMREVFENCLNLLSTAMEGVYHRRHEALPFEAALESASRMCSTNAAALLGLDDRGELGAGKRADLVLVRIDGEPGAYRVDVEKTWVGGCEVT